MNHSSCMKINKEWDIVGARQLGREIARKVGFGTVDQARIATAISELARNIYLYAEDGRIIIKIVDDFGKKGIHLRVVDSGPGIPDISKVMKDGYTTSSGLGAGLPGVRRLMDEFDLKSDVESGTEINVVKWLR